MYPLQIVGLKCLLSTPKIYNQSQITPGNYTHEWGLCALQFCRWVIRLGFEKPILIQWVGFLKACTAVFIVLNGHHGGFLSTLFWNFPWADRHKITIFKIQRNVTVGGMTPLQHYNWPKVVKFYKNDHFIAWIDQKTGNKQQKHNFVICPPPQFSKILKMSKFTSPFWPFKMQISSKFQAHLLKDP